MKKKLKLDNIFIDSHFETHIQSLNFNFLAVV